MRHTVYPAMSRRHGGHPHSLTFLDLLSHLSFAHCLDVTMFYIPITISTFGNIIFPLLLLSRKRARVDQLKQQSLLSTFY